MDPGKIHVLCRCSACLGALQPSPFMVQLPVKAEWSYPVWGNFITGHSNMAVAYVCDGCTKKPVMMADIKEAVEFQGDAVIYHPLRWSDLGLRLDLGGFS